jgi:AIPR protein
LGGLNARIRARQADIQSALYDANAKFVLVIAHTGQQGLAPPISEALNNFVTSQNDTSEIMSLRILAQVDLHKAVSAGVAGAPIALEVHLTNWGQIREPHVAFYGQVCAADVARWMTDHGSRLFSSNIRQVLSGSSVNEDIVATLKERPLDFWYLNNGITAIVSDVAKKPIGGTSTESGIFECAGFSVVNGAQTVGSIHAAFSVAPQQVEKANVALRIISTTSAPTFGTEVTRCTNTQNAIAKRDFVALDPEQERIRQELHFDGIEYAFKAGATSGPSAARFDLTEATLAQACSGDVDMAIQAKREISKLWDDITKPPYKALFNAGISGPDLWQKVRALRSVEKELQVATKKHAGRDALICVHGNRFIEWAVMKALSIKPGDTFNASEQAVQQIVDSTALKVIAAVRNNYPDSYPASLFKNLTKCRSLALAF